MQRLATFAGQNGAGPWSLIVADLAPGDEGTLDGWCLEISGP